MKHARGWVDGLLLDDLQEISEDLSVLDDGRFWAVIGSYEGQWRLARFASVKRAELPASPTWRGASGWQSSLTRESYCQGVETLRAKIARGEIYQANLCRVMTAECEADTLLPLAHRIASGNPAPYAAWFDLPDIQVVCASPERFLEREGEVILSSPIKGTASTEGELLDKDRAENVMIVDLVRHDLGRICRTGTITTPRLLVAEQHPGLVHLVSDVRGELRPGIGWQEILAATFPPGSITGAPKVSAMKAIAELETTPRGPYCGAIGWIHGKKARLAVGIRTFYQQRGILHFGTGAGITWGSDPLQEWAETELKARRLIALAEQA